MNILSRMRSQTAIAAIALLAVCLGGATATASLGKYHEDDRIGYKIKTPRDWTFTAQSADENWIVAKFLCDRNYTFNHKDYGTMNHRPEMTAIAFIEAVVSKEGKKEKVEDEDIILISNPYRDYKDYLKRTFSGGGWFVSKEEKGKVGDVEVTEYEIKVEKLTSSGPKRLITWVYHLSGVDVAVQYEVLENSYDKLKGDVHASLKSFRPITRTKALTTERTGVLKFRNEDKMTVEERREYRQERERVQRDKAVKKLADDWEVFEHGPFLILLHGDKKFAKRCADQAAAMWKYLDKTFSFFGPEEYIPQPIIRVCKDRAEERSFLSSGSWWTRGSEIVTHRDPDSGSGSWEFEYVNQKMVGIWFRNRNGDAWSATPYWLRYGIDQVVGTARLKGSRVTFKEDSWERDGLRKIKRAGTLMPPKTLVMLKRADFRTQELMQQSAALIRFFMSSKSKKYRNIVTDYLRGIQKAVADRKAKEKAKEGKSSRGDTAKTEEEEEEMMKKRKERYKEAEEEFLQEVFNTTFGEWSEKDWKKLQDAYFKSVG